MLKNDVVMLKNDVFMLNMTAPRSNKLPLSVDGHTIFAVSPLHMGTETDIIPQFNHY
jgi:hypothetical protein